MNEQVKSFTKSSVNGYIDDVKEIEKITKRLLEIKESAFGNEFMNNCLDTVMDSLYLERSDLKNVPLKDILCLFDNIPKSAWLEEDNESYRECMRDTYFWHLSEALRHSEKNNTTIRMFLSATVKGYLEHLAVKAGFSKAGTKNLYRLYRIFLRDSIDFKIEEKTTVRELLRGIDARIHKIYYPYNPVEEYGNYIKLCFTALYMFFSEYHRKAYPEIFDFEKVKEKYELYDEDSIILSDEALEELKEEQDNG
ncbi:MAG: hypothetical protein ACI4KH_01830 [Oscillospiraceae bacterium]